MSKMVSVIIPTYNRCEDLNKLLHSIMESSYPNVEVIVVDNASTDATKSVVSSYCSKAIPLHYVYSNVNLNAGGGRAEGVRHAEGDYYLFIDDDNEIATDMIAELVKFLEQHLETGLAAPLSLGGKDGRNVGALGCGINLRTSRAEFRYSGIPVDDVDLNGTYPTIAATNSFMMTREAYEKSGGWDPYFEIMYEETDLGLRVQQAGYEQYYVPTARTLHLGAVGEYENTTLRGLGIGSPRRAFTFARNRSIMMRRYADAGSKVIYFAFYLHVFTCYYVLSALRLGRNDIAWGYFKGAWNGCFCKLYQDKKSEIKKTE